MAPPVGSKSGAPGLSCAWGRWPAPVALIATPPSPLAPNSKYVYDRAKESGDEAGVRHWRRRHREMQRERNAVRGTDREAQVSAITASRDEMAALRPFLPSS